MGGDAENSTVTLPDEWINCTPTTNNRPSRCCRQGFSSLRLRICVSVTLRDHHLRIPSFSETVRDKILDHNRPHRYKHEICVSPVQTAMKDTVRRGQVPHKVTWSTAPHARSSDAAHLLSPSHDASWRSHLYSSYQ